MTRKLAGWAVLALVLLYAFTNPAHTAELLRHFGAAVIRFAFALVRS